MKLFRTSISPSSMILKDFMMSLSIPSSKASFLPTFWDLCLFKFKPANKSAKLQIFSSTAIRSFQSYSSLVTPCKMRNIFRSSFFICPFLLIFMNDFIFKFCKDSACLLTSMSPEVSIYATCGMDGSIRFIINMYSLSGFSGLSMMDLYPYLIILSQLLIFFLAGIINYSPPLISLKVSRQQNDCLRWVKYLPTKMQLGEYDYVSEGRMGASANTLLFGQPATKFEILEFSWISLSWGLTSCSKFANSLGLVVLTKFLASTWYMFKNTCYFDFRKFDK